MKKQSLAIFLDRDGTINEDVNFLSSPEQLILIDGSAEAIKEANEMGLKVIVFTNQSGIEQCIANQAPSFYQLSPLSDQIPFAQLSEKSEQQRGYSHYIQARNTEIGRLIFIGE